ncbi:MAG: hypothetical protein K5924_12755 [Chloroflexi bacterium]|nr:hypothetical protein [Chloroflexota bacterium]
MKSIKDWFISLFRREPVEPFVAEDDPFVQRMRHEREESKDNRRERRRDWMAEPLRHRFIGDERKDGGRI